jgi:hypothetical protein
MRPQFKLGHNSQFLLMAGVFVPNLMLDFLSAKHELQNHGSVEASESDDIFESVSVIP